MTWDESKHPRDNIGRFTYSGDNGEESSEGAILEGRAGKIQEDKSL